MQTALRWRFRELAARNRVSNRKVAAALDVHETTVSRWKTADSMPALTQAQIEAIAQAIGCTEAELLGLD